LVESKKKLEKLNKLINITTQISSMSNCKGVRKQTA